MVFAHRKTPKVLTVLLSTSVFLTMATETLASPNMSTLTNRTSFAATASADKTEQVEIESVTATNGIITVKLTGNPKDSLTADNFTFLLKIDDKREKAVSATSFTWDEAQNTVHVTFKPIAATKAKQNVAISVLFNDVKTAADVFTIAERNAKIAEVKIYNGSKDFVLTPDSDESLQLTAIAEDKDGNILAGKKATWSSDNKSVATVDKNGMVKAVGVGTATITATIERKTAKAKVKVTEGAATIKDITASNGLVTVTFTKAPEKAPKLSDFSFKKWVDKKEAQKLVMSGFTWNESTSSASFTFKPLAAASKKQKVVIGVSYADATMDADAFFIAAKNAKVEKVKIQHTFDTDLTLNSDHADLQLIAIATDSEDQIVAGKKVSWKSDNTEVATVDRNGKVQAVGVGTTTITATVDGKWATIRVSVKSTATPPSLTLGTSMLSESAANDGSISMVQTISISNGEFVEHPSASDIVVNNLPVGLGVNVTQSSSTQLTIAFTGAAVNHTAADSRSNLSVTIVRSAIKGATENITSEAFGIRFADSVVVVPPGPTGPTLVILAVDSLGKVGNGKITNLQAGVKYVVTFGGKTYGVQQNGSLGAENSPAEALAGTEITGLKNGIAYKVEEEAVFTERLQVALYRTAANATVIEGLLAANQLGLNVSSYHNLDATGKTAVAAKLNSQKSTFTSKNAIQTVLDAAVAVENKVASFRMALSPSEIEDLLASNDLGLTTVSYGNLDTSGKIAVSSELFGERTGFTSKVDIQNALDTAVTHVIEQAKVDAYKNAANEADIKALLDAAQNVLGLDVVAYRNLDATGKTNVSAELYGGKAAFANKSAIQSALDAAVSGEAKVAAYRLAQDADQFKGLLGSNSLGLALTAYNQLDTIGKTVVAGVLEGQKAAFATKTDIQTALDAAVASEAKLAAYRSAADAAAIEGLLAVNQLGLDVLGYNALDVTGKTTVSGTLNSQKAGFTSKAAIQAALDAAVASEAKLAAYRSAADAAAIEGLLAVNQLGLDVLGYNALDVTGKTTVLGTLNSQKASFTSKAAIQAVLDAAVNDEIKISAYRVAPDSHEIENLLTANDLALDLTAYNQLDSGYKTSVAIGLFNMRADFTSKDKIKTALDSLVANAIEQVKVDAYKNAANAAIIKALLDAEQNVLGLDVVAYRNLDATGKTNVSAELYGGKAAFANKSAIQSALDAAVAIEAKVAAYRLAEDADEIKSLLAANELGLDLTSYNQLDNTGKTAVAQVLFGQKATFKTADDILEALNNAVPSEAMLASYRMATSADEMKNLLDANLIGLDLTAYNELDDQGKLTVAAVLVDHQAEFLSVSAIQGALNPAAQNEAKIAVYRMAGDAGVIQGLLDENALSIDQGDYPSLDSMRQNKVAQQIFDSKGGLGNADILQNSVKRLAAIQAIVDAARRANWTLVDGNTFARSGYNFSVDFVPFVENAMEYKYGMRGEGIGDYFNMEVDEIPQQINLINLGATNSYYWTGVDWRNFVVAGIKGVSGSNFNSVKNAVTVARAAKGGDLSAREIQDAVDSLK
ncbi:Ig-like domain-containing protein [Brevibacillus ginsengisoli]|uniref:Ig-like domain-containing protein n=1 Tax=Brevibacillus ginsengisoli TaxID=363854 RepID=UPI003CF46C16